MKKTIKRVLTGLLTAGVIFACSASVFAAPKFEKLPTLVYSELDGLMKQQNIGIDYAEDKIYNEGLQIYSAMDKNAQEIAERKVKEWKTPTDTNLQIGYMLMDFDGRILATVGGRQEKDGRLLWDYASQSALQPGSTIKPVSSFVLALEDKSINFSSTYDFRYPYLGLERS